MHRFLLISICLFFILVGNPALCRAQDVLSLETIINRALEANIGILDSQDSIRRADLQLTSAEADFELKILPGAGVGFTGGDDDSDRSRVNLEVTLQKRLEYGTQVSLTPGVYRSDGEYKSQARMRVVQPLLRGLNREFNLSGIDASRFDQRTARRQHYQKEVETVLSAVQRAYEVIRQRELSVLQEESAQRLLHHVEAAAIKEPMGLVSAIDLYRARIQANQAQEELLRSREAYSDALDALKAFLSVPLEREIAVEAPLTFDHLEIDLDEMVSFALTSRIEMEQAEDAISETRRRSRVAREDTKPELNIEVSFTRSGAATRSFPGDFPSDNAWGISLGSTTDIQRTSQRAAFEESLLSIRSVVRQQTNIRDEVTNQVKREARSLQRQEYAIANQEEQIQQSLNQMELSKVKFQHGLASNFDLIEAEIALRRAQTELVSTVIDYIVGQYRLRAVLGTLVQRPERFF